MLVAHQKGLRACAVLLMPLLGGHAAKAEVFPTNSSSVIVDYSVLEQLGPPGTLPQMMVPQIRPAPSAPVRRDYLPRPGSRPLHLGMPAKDSGPPVQKETLRQESAPKETTPKAAARKEATQREDTPRTPSPMPPPKPSIEETVAVPPSGNTPANADVLPTPVMPPPAQAPQISIAPTSGGAVVLAPAPPSLLTPPPRPRKVEEQEEQKETAPSARDDSPEDRLTVLFPATVTDIPEEAKPRLRHLAEQVLRLPETKLRLMAYAGGETADAGKARRISLARALAVRAYLMERQIPHTRFDVRALGNRIKDGETDRVDIIVLSR